MSHEDLHTTPLDIICGIIIKTLHSKIHQSAADENKKKRNEIPNVSLILTDANQSTKKKPPPVKIVKTLKNQLQKKVLFTRSLQ